MNDTIILITGAAGGLGSALAEQLARSGANLLLTDKDLKGLEQLSDRLLAAGLPEPGITSLDLATASPESYRELAEILEHEYGGLDIFIHSAAAFGGLQPLEHIEWAEWDACFRVNLHSAWQITRSCLPMLRQSRHGRVVLIGEQSEVCGSAYRGAYGASKAALNCLAGIMQEEFEGSRLEVFVPMPGPMRTELRARAYISEDPASLPDPADAASEIIRQLKDNMSC